MSEQPDVPANHDTGAPADRDTGDTRGASDLADRDARDGGGDTPDIPAAAPPSRDRYEPI